MWYFGEAQKGNTTPEKTKITEVLGMQIRKQKAQLNAKTKIQNNNNTQIWKKFLKSLESKPCAIKEQKSLWVWIF